MSVAEETTVSNLCNSSCIYILWNFNHKSIKVFINSFTCLFTPMKNCKCFKTNLHIKMVLYLMQLWWFKAREFYLNKTYVGSSSVNSHLFASLVYVRIHCWIFRSISLKVKNIRCLFPKILAVGAKMIFCNSKGGWKHNSPVSHSLSSLCFYPKDKNKEDTLQYYICYSA